MGVGRETTLEWSCFVFFFVVVYSGSWARPSQWRKRILPFLVIASTMIRSSNQEFRNVVRMHTSSLERCRKQEEESPTPLLDFEEVMAQIYKSTCHTFHTFRTWVIADSLRVTHWNGTSSKGGPGGYGRAGPPQEGERTLHRNKQTRVLCPRGSTGPLVGSSRTRFHWARRSTMTWRHAGWGHGILRRSGLALYLFLYLLLLCPVRAGALSWLQC